MLWRWSIPIRHYVFLICLILGTGLMPASAQDEASTVPDLTGLNVPQAAAVLNRDGLRLGATTAQAWTAAAALPPGAIGGQQIAAGTAVPPGTAVDVTILSAANIRLLYDDNDLTLINNTGATLDLTQLVFNTHDGARRFAAARWRNSLETGDCTQVWSVNRGSAKNIAECGSIFWLTSNDTAEHFWTQTTGATRFDVIQAGVPVATCDAAPPGTQDNPLVCDFYVIAGVDTGPATSYVYFAYTPERFMAVNRATDAWMPLNRTPIQIPGLDTRLSDPALFGNPDIVADVGRLAPGQCSLLTVAPVNDATLLEDCDLIAQNNLEPSRAFWTVNFEILPATRPGERLTCPAATPGRITLCVMPR